MDLANGFEAILAGIYDPADGRLELARRRKRSAIVALALAGLTAGGVGIAAADSLYGTGHAHSGLQVTEEGNTSEIINLFATDFPAAARQVAQQMQAHGLRFGPDFHADTVDGTLVYVPGSDPQKTIEADIASRVREGGKPGPSAVQTSLTGVQGSFAFQSMCTWNLSWLRAHNAGDAPAMSADVAGMRELAQLPVMGPINEAHYESGLADDAERGDPTNIQLFTTANCPVTQP